jgi:hypothetical protein
MKTAYSLLLNGEGSVFISIIYFNPLKGEFHPGGIYKLISYLTENIASPLKNTCRLMLYRKVFADILKMIRNSGAKYSS